MLVIEAYRTLRDRGPYPADQVVKDLDGSFAFIVCDTKTGTVFASLVSSLDLKKRKKIKNKAGVLIFGGNAYLEV